MHASVLTYPNAAYPGSAPSTPSQMRANSANATLILPLPSPFSPSSPPVEVDADVDAEKDELARRSCSPEKTDCTNASPAGVCVPRPYTSVTRKARAFVGGPARIAIWSMMTCAAACRFAVPSAVSEKLMSVWALGKRKVEGADSWNRRSRWGENQWVSTRGVLVLTYLMPKNTAYSVVSGSSSLDWFRNVFTERAKPGFREGMDLGTTKETYPVRRNRPA